MYGDEKNGKIIKQDSAILEEECLLLKCMYMGDSISASLTFGQGADSSKVYVKLQNTSQKTAHCRYFLFYKDSAGTIVDADGANYAQIAPGETFEKTFYKPTNIYTYEDISFKTGLLAWSAGDTNF